MQQRHFWYRGRHRFLWDAVRRWANMCPGGLGRVVDLGGGCGGWLDYLMRQNANQVTEAALADSSLDALRFAKDVLPSGVARFQIDLLELHWTDHLETVFLLDVLEHMPEDERALRQIHHALSPRGLLFVACPALQMFWTWNDDAVRHVRRYCKADFRRLAEACGLKLLAAGYFQFFLSPLLPVSRWVTSAQKRNADATKQAQWVAAMHRVPSPAINEPLAALFSLETPLGHCIPFPWGTSILAVFKKKDSQNGGLS